MAMVVERTEKELIIKVSGKLDTADLQDLLDYLRYKELVADISVDQQKVDALADSINRQWWKKNKKRLLS